MIVVKVGGSLYSHPKLGHGLQAWLQSLNEPVLLVPGGGPFADAVRQLNRIHGLAETASHWLAIRAMDQAGEFLKSLGIDSPILDTYDFCRTNTALPESWHVTSDSIAALTAKVYCASRLVLLKSIDIPADIPWTEAAARGWVDAHFPYVVPETAYEIQSVNFRLILGNEKSPAGSGGAGSP